MNADIDILYKSSFYEIRDFRCKCIHHSTSGPEYQEHFCISYIRKGNFIFNIFRNTLDAFNGQFLINKPGHEQIVTHYDNRPDRCTVFSFSKSFYELLKTGYRKSSEWFFSDNDIQTIIIRASAETEYLHGAIIKAVKFNMLSSLLIDSLVIEMVSKVTESINNKNEPGLPPQMKKYHLTTIESAKEFIQENFDKDISLFDISEKCFTSPFHFSRIFKKFTGISPHQYLMEMRLKNADFLLKNTSLPVTQICFESGFNNADYFSTAFKKKYKIQPSRFRSK